MPKEVLEAAVEPGDFPFPLTAGPQESRYLTWIRNHSNYMAVRGLLDYIRAVAVLLRGALVNALVGLPVLLVIAVLVAILHVWPDTPGFHISLWVLGLAAAVVVLYPFLAFLAKIIGFRRSLGTGSDSTVKRRDRHERYFGGILILVVGVAAVEALPAFLGHFHFWVYDRQLGWPTLASVTGVVLAAYTALDKLRSIAGGVAKKAALLAVGALGLVMPILVVLFVADFLVFSRPPSSDSTWRFAPLIAAVVLPVGVFLVLLIGSVARAFSRKDVFWMSVLLVLSLALVALVNLGDDSYVEWAEEDGVNLAVATQRISDQRELRTEFDKLVRDVEGEPGPRLRELADRVAVFDRAFIDESTTGEPDASLDELLNGLLDSLENHAFAVDSYEVFDLKETVREQLESGDMTASDELADEIRRVRNRVAFLLTLPDPQSGVASLARFAFDDLGSLAPTGLATLEKEYPRLWNSARNEFLAADSGLDSWYWLLDGVRLEVAARAVYSPTGYPAIYKETADVRKLGLWPKVTLVLMIAVLVWCFCWLTVDVNLTSIHGLYRDRLASAFLIGADTRGDVDIEEDLDLGDLSRHEAGSTAPYHLINVALNLQGSRDIGIRDRRSDFFVFSKKFIGGRRTGYCRSETMERVFPQMSLSTAMAISAAAASPNMGRATSPALTAFMTLLNVRLGIWVPNPGFLQEKIEAHPRRPEDDDGAPRGFSFPEVFREELVEVGRRWKQLPGRSDRSLAADETRATVEHGLVGIGFSGGGIRSATLNLGIAQALHRRGVFDHIDYMSTVSGGGYLGSSLSALMRRRTTTESEVAGRVSVRINEAGEKVVGISPEEPAWPIRLLRWTRERLWRTRRVRPAGPREYRYASFAQLAVADGGRVKAGQRLLGMGESPGRGPGSFGEQFRWRVRPNALLREMTGRLDETRRWVNVSDGGHIENLAGIELLRRRCKYILIGDGEADPNHGFGGLATLIRSARIDLGIHIDIDVDGLRLGEDRLSRSHWAIGRIQYPGETEHGYLLYLKSSVTGDEDEVIREYRHGHPAFPHESTADQMFSEGQFEAYRSLGQHIGEQVLAHLPVRDDAKGARGASFADLALWFTKLAESGRAKPIPS